MDRVAQHPSPILHLPPRPRHYVGREELLQTIIHTLCTMESGWCTITGMPGIGKSALTFEAVHQLATDMPALLTTFPDGIVFFSMAGRQGEDGLLALLCEIIALFSSPETASLHPPTDLAGLVHRTRMVLAGKRILLLLDGLDAHFPWRQAEEALLSCDYTYKTGLREGDSRVVLATSRYILFPGKREYHFHLGPLAIDEAIALFSALLGRPLQNKDQTYAERICMAAGSLPLAIEAAATAVALGTPLGMLADSLEKQPLNRLLDSDGELHSRLAKLCNTLDEPARQRFILLALLGSPSFALESALAIDAEMLPEKVDNGIVSDLMSPASAIGITADLGQLVRHSVVEIDSGDAINGPEDAINRSLRGAMGPEDAIDGFRRYWAHPLLYAYAREQLEQLEPVVLSVARHNLQQYALAYVEHYRGDVPQLERGKECLCAALAQAWRQEQYEHVVQLVTGLAYVVGRGGGDDFAENRHLLLSGIHACRCIQDQHHLAFFLNRLCGLYIAYGEYSLAQKAWEESLAIAHMLGRSVSLWEPLCSLVHIADILGDYPAAQQFAESLLQPQPVDETDDTASVSVALFIRGYYARVTGRRDLALADLSASLELLAMHNATSPLYRDFFEMEVKTELARAQGDYSGSRMYTEATVALAQKFCDSYTIAVLLLDQAMYAYRQGVLNDARPLILRFVELARQLGTPHLNERSMYLLLKLSESSHTYPLASSLQPEGNTLQLNAQRHNPLLTIDSSQGISYPFHERLSERELAILQLIAVGLSNREIATKLIISVGTVKKHVEHIYNKLDVHSRVQAVTTARELGLLE